MTDLLNPLAVAGHNQPSAFELIRDEINDLYEEAKNFADGAAIETQEMHDTIDRLHSALHEAGKRADEARIEEKRPFDEAAAEVQSRYNPLIQPKKGRVALAKDALSALMLPWRQKVQREKAEIAAAAKAEAERLAEEARAKLAASQGNLAEREAAETLVKEAAAVGRFAKAATKGPTGLRSVWRAELVDIEQAMDWCYARAPEEFRALAQSHADSQVRAGMRMVPGFRVWEDKVANG